MGSGITDDAAVFGAPFSLQPTTSPPNCSESETPLRAVHQASISTSELHGAGVNLACPSITGRYLLVYLIGRLGNAKRSGNRTILDIPRVPGQVVFVLKVAIECIDDGRRNLDIFGIRRNTYSTWDSL